MDTNNSNRLFFVRTALVALSFIVAATSVSAAPQSAVVGRDSSSNEQEISQRFRIGATRRSVVDVAGLPDARLSGEIWIYYEWRMSSENPIAKNGDTLVVAFKQDRVVAMKLTDGNALRALLARRNIKVTGPSYADLLR